MVKCHFFHDITVLVKKGIKNKHDKVYLISLKNFYFKLFDLPFKNFNKFKN